MLNPSAERRARSSTQSRLKAAKRTTRAGDLVCTATGLAKRPCPRPRYTPSEFEPGLMVTRSIGPPGVSGPAATPVVDSRLVTTGEFELASTADNPVPAR